MRVHAQVRSLALSFKRHKLRVAPRAVESARAARSGTSPLADAARDQRETALALRGDVTEPGADASGPLALVTTQQNSVTRHAGGDPFDAHEPPEEFTREEVPRVYAGESDFYTLMDSYDRLAGRHEYAIGYAKLARSSRAAMWREKEKARDDLETARKEIARLNEARLEEERSYDRLDVEFERATHAYNAAEDERIRANNRADKARDDLEAARKEIARLNEVRAQRDSAVAELRVALGKLEGQLEAAQTENARLHQLNLELVTARHDALLSDIVRLKKRARVEDNNVAADEAKLDAGEETFRSAGGVLVDAEGFIARLPGEDSLAYSERCYNLLDVEFGKMIGEANRMRREVSKTREKNRCLEDELKDAREEIARLNEALQDELRAQRDSAVAELAQKKRRRLDDDATANQ